MALPANVFVDRFKNIYGERKKLNPWPYVSALITGPGDHFRDLSTINLSCFILNFGVQLLLDVLVWFAGYVSLIASGLC